MRIHYNGISRNDWDDAVRSECGAYTCHNWPNRCDSIVAQPALAYPDPNTTPVLEVSGMMCRLPGSCHSKANTHIRDVLGAFQYSTD